MRTVHLASYKTYMLSVIFSLFSEKSSHSAPCFSSEIFVIILKSVRYDCESKVQDEEFVAEGNSNSKVA